MDYTAFSLKTNMEFDMSEEAQKKHSETKQMLLATFFAKYSDLIEFVNALDIHQQFKLNAITRVDEFMFWVREGIINLPIPVEVVVPPGTVPEIEEEKVFESAVFD